MSEKTLRRRIPSFPGRKTSKTTYPSPSPRRRYSPSSKKSSKQVKKSTPILKRCSSEPILFTAGLFTAGEDLNRNLESEFVLFRGHTCLDLCVGSASSNLLLSQNPISCFEDYNKDAKVVVNVTVEGSPGPIRTMVRLGSSVDETIRLVVDKYGEEGRCPKLEFNAVSAFELHHSHFSLQSLKGTDAMGDVGSRSFYLRKSNSNHSSDEGDHKPEVKSSSPSAAVPRYFIFFPDFISRKISKIMRRTQKVWKVLLHCG